MAEDYSQLVARAYQLQAEEQARQAQEQQVAQQRAAEAALLTRNRSTGEFLQDAGVQLVQGAVGLGQAAYGLTNLATLGGLDRVTGFSENFRTTNEILQGAKSAPTQAQVQNARRIFKDEGVLAGVGEYATDFTLLQDLLIGNLPSLIPAAAAGRGAAVAATEAATAAGLGQAATRELVNQAAQRATLRAVAGQTAGATNVEAINQIDQYGGDENLQQLGGLGAGVLAGAAAPLISQLTGAARLEAAAANLLPGGAGALPGLTTRGVVSAATGGALREGTEEYAQSGTEQLAQNIVTPGRGLWEGVNEQAALGALAGGVLGGGMGTAVALGTPRSSASTPLGQRIRSMLGQHNQATGSPLAASPLLDPVIPSPIVTMETGPMDVEEINLGDAPLPGELPLAQALPTVEELPVEEINAAPAPLRSLFDITGRRPQVSYPTPPLVQVEELPPAQRSGLLGVIDAQRGRGRLGGTDLFAGPLDPQGAFPSPTPVADAASAPTDVPKAQASLDFDAPPLTWKKSLAQELGLKPNSFRGKAWDQFTRAAEAAGVRPGDPGAVDFLRAIAPQIAADPATAPLFAARLAEKYAAPAQAEQQVAAPAGTLEDALALDEDAYIRAVNPSGKTTDAEDLVTTSIGDFSLPANTQVVEQFADSTGAMVNVHQDAEGNFYAEQNGQVLGELLPGAEDTLTNVVQEAQGRGIGTGLTAAYIRRNPFAQAGSFSPAGERTRRAAFRRLQAERAAAAAQQDGTPAPVFDAGGDYARTQGAILARAAELAGVSTASIETAYATDAGMRDAVDAAEGRLIDPQAPLPTGEYIALKAQALAEGYREYLGRADERTAKNNELIDQAARRVLQQGESADPMDVAEAVDVVNNPMTGTRARDALAGATPAPAALRRAFAANDAQPAITVTGNKQVRSGATDEGTYYEVALSDGSKERIYRQVGDGGVQLSGWYWAPAEGREVYIGENKSEALRNLPEAVTRRRDAVQSAAAGQAFAPAAPTDAVTPGGAANDVAPIGLAATIAKQRALDPTASEEQHIADAMMDLLADATNVELLDETFIALKNSPEWKLLGDDQQTEIAEEFDIRYARVEGGTSGKFQRANAPVDKPIEVALFTNLVANANRTRATGAPEVVPIESPADFEVATGQAAPQDAAGIFSDGKVYLVRQNIGSAHDLAVTLAHERGHAGIAALLGDRMPAVLSRLWANAATRERIKAKMKALAGNVEPSDGGMRRLAAEEVLADMLASGEKINGDVLTKARSAVDNTFSRLLGYSSLKMTNAEVDAILRDAGAVMRGTSPSAIARGEPKYLQGLTDLMGDPRSTADIDPKFSRLLADLDQVTAAADAEGPGTRRNVNEITKLAGQAGLNAVKNLGASVKEGGAFATLLDATPLNQLVNLYGKQFTDGDAKPLNDFARLKRAKESDFNKQLTQPSDLSYRQGDAKVKTSPLELAKQWQEFQRKSPAKGEALNQMQQFSTLYRLWPDSTWDEQSRINYAEHSFTEGERRAALNDLHRLWKAVGPEGQSIFRDSQAVYTSLWNKRFNALRNELARATGLDPKSPQFNQVYGRTIDSALQRLKTGPYSPLQRYGDYLVTVRDKDGRIAWFSGHDTKVEADTVAKQLAESDFKITDEFRINTTERPKFDWRLDGVSQAVINNLEKVALDALPGDDQSAVREEVRRALVEAYLQSLPQQSFLHHANKRKGVDGFTADAFRGFNDYSIKAARSIASLNYDGQISSKLNELQTFVTEKARGQGQTDTTKMQRVLNAVKSQHAASLNFERSPTADALSQAGFLWFMTSPSQLFINSMQTPMVTLPRLAGTYGNSKALGAVRTAIGAFAKSKGDLLGGGSTLPADSPERRVLQQLYERGVLDFTLAHDMTGLANGESSAMSGHWRRFMEVASSFMHRSEVFNRQVTALAAARLEMERRGLNANNISDADLNSLADSAEEAVLTTQFDYSQSNKPKLLQGPWRKLIFQFQQYRLNMLAMMAKDIRDGFIAKDVSAEERSSARRALSWLLGMQLALTGAAGTVLAPFVFAIADAFRDDEDLLDSRTEFVNAVPQWLAHGVLAGALDTSRLGADSLIPILGDRVYAPKDATAQETFNYYVMRNIGPWAGLVGGAVGGVDKAFNGDAVGAVKGLMPAPIRDFYKALYESQAGARDARQVVYFEPGVWDTVTGAVGLRSGERRQVEGIRGASFEAANRANTLRQRYLTQLAIGHATGDQELVDGAMQKIQAWNGANPEQGIRPGDIRRAVVNRYRAQVNADLYGVPSARPPSEALKAQLGL